MFSTKFLLQAFTIASGLRYIFSNPMPAPPAALKDNVDCWMGFRKHQNGSTACFTGKTYYYCPTDTCQMVALPNSAPSFEYNHLTLFFNCNYHPAHKDPIQYVLAEHWEQNQDGTIRIFMGFIAQGKTKTKLPWDKVICPKAGNEHRSQCDSCQPSSETHLV
ncbi:hypothetical protein O181_041988 [Austropuccinia psidii MF-1]|uniref:Secreted protein n=1 Tax=Austropuccinia psidii MF-1 TaxID=1389203 RepID=A0A9Q3DK95_9BASI|nr:hypothetical protein [Austropuccinia psidii MF-1]